MRRWVWGIALAVIILGAGIWGYRVMFPGPERVIRERLALVEKLANIAPNEAPLAKLANAQQLAACFTDNPQILIEGTGHGRVVINGQRDLQDAVRAARSQLTQLKVEFLDVNVAVAADKQTALVNLTGKATVPGDSDLMVQELNFQMRKEGRAWLVSRVETVKTLR